MRSTQSWPRPGLAMKFPSSRKSWMKLVSKISTVAPGYSTRSTDPTIQHSSRFWASRSSLSEADLQLVPDQKGCLGGNLRSRVEYSGHSLCALNTRARSAILLFYRILFSSSNTSSFSDLAHILSTGNRILFRSCSPRGDAPQRVGLYSRSRKE